MGQLAEFASNHPFLMTAVLVSLAGVLYYELRLRGTGHSQVSTGDAVRLINKGALVIDVRKPENFSNGHIVNARNIELGAIESDGNIVKKPKNKVVLTVCENGFESGKAAALLRKAGFEHVYSIKAGLSGWRADNLPLVR